MTLSDLEWLSEIFNDTKHSAFYLRQLSFLFTEFRQSNSYPRSRERISCFPNTEGVQYNAPHLSATYFTVTQWITRCDCRRNRCSDDRRDSCRLLEPLRWSVECRLLYGVTNLIRTICNSRCNDCNLSLQLLPRRSHVYFCRTMLCISAAYAVMRCLSVCLCVSVCVSVTFVDHVKTNKDIFEIISPLGSHTILVFPCQTA